MKRIAVLLMATLLTLSSCAGRTVRVSFARSGTDAADPPESAGPAEGTEQVRAVPDTDLSRRAAEFDLTALNAQMAYVQLSNMMLSPEEYRGKTVKLRGRFAHAAEETKEFFVCYLTDVTACCSQSLEFETDGVYDFPAGYPAAESEITVFGVFDDYEYNGYRMYRLTGAEVDY